MQKKQKKPSVLLVDDDSFMRETLKLILQSEEYPVIGEAFNGEDAVEFCVHSGPGLVLLDINMPKMDGLQALEEIHKVSPKTIVMMISAEATMDRVKEAIGRGAAGFIVKPLSPASVLDRISQCLKTENKE